jgi:hypothetical protein
MEGWDCATAPRNGLVSGCYPLDEFYKGRSEAERLKEAKGTMDFRCSEVQFP